MIELTFHALRLDVPGQLVNGGEKDIDMGDKSLCDENTFRVCTVAHIQEHVRDACRGRLFKTRKDTPNLVNLLLHDVFFLANPVPVLIGGIKVLLRRLQRLTCGGKADIPKFVDHIALRMPVLILTIAEDFDKLFQDRSVTTMTALGELGGVMEMAVDLAFMLVIGVLCTKYSWTHGAGEMFDMVFTLQGRDIRAAQSTTTLVTEQIQTSKIVDLAKGILSTAIFPVDREKLGRDNLAAVLQPQPSQRQI